jgi:hypothetical protein
MDTVNAMVPVLWPNARDEPPRARSQQEIGILFINVY